MNPEQEIRDGLKLAAGSGAVIGLIALGVILVSMVGAS